MEIIYNKKYALEQFIVRFSDVKKILLKFLKEPRERERERDSESERERERRFISFQLKKNLGKEKINNLENIIKYIENKI